MNNFKINLPDKPIDQFTIEYYRLFVTSNYYYINKIKAVYHINTSWNKYSPKEKGGANLINDWMLYEDEYCRGRITGWSNILSCEEEGYATKREAIIDAIQYYDKSIEHTKNDIKIMNDLRYVLLKQIDTNNALNIVE